MRAGALRFVRGSLRGLHHERRLVQECSVDLVEKCSLLWIRDLELRSREKAGSGLFLYLHRPLCSPCRVRSFVYPPQSPIPL